MNTLEPSIVLEELASKPEDSAPVDKKRRRGPGFIRPGKHTASKPGHQHPVKLPAKRSDPYRYLTNHERCVMGRCRRMRISLDEYKKRFCS